MLLTITLTATVCIQTVSHESSDCSSFHWNVKCTRVFSQTETFELNILNHTTLQVCVWLCIRSSSEDVKTWSAVDLDIGNIFLEIIIAKLYLLCSSFQTTDDARQLLKYLDEDLGKPLPEQSYGEDCRLYTPGHPKGSFHTFLVSCIEWSMVHVVSPYILIMILLTWVMRIKTLVS